jgi:hypothetical protein
MGIHKRSRRKERKSKSKSGVQRSNPLLWEKIVSRVKSGSRGGKKGQWSARKAQLAVLEYKKEGGKYKGKKSENNSLVRWTRQKWRTKSGRPSLETGERYLPEQAIKSLTSREYSRTSASKRRGMKKGRQYVSQPKSISYKTKKYIQ